MTIVDILAIILVGLQVADFATTYVALGRPKFREANPIVAELIDRLGLFCGLLVAKGIATLCAAYVWFDGNDVILGLGCVIYTMIVLSNLRQLRRRQ